MAGPPPNGFQQPPPPDFDPAFDDRGPGPPHPGPPHHHLIDPILYPALLTFLCGLVIIGLGAWLTAGWFRKLLFSEKELLANVSHELRTPVARIRVALDLAAEGDAQTARASLSEIATDLGELERLIEDVLTATRFELASGTPAAFGLRRERVAAWDVVQQAVSRFRAAHPTRQLELIGERASPPPLAGEGREGGARAARIDVDPMLFRRVLDNLLENADKYSPDPTSAIALEVAAEPRRVVFAVRDRGVGISAADLPHVFAPFFRGERSRDRQSGGVGLGLTLARRIVEALGGSISIESRAGDGTTARVVLPRVQ
jgi:signal transduction histidine kinase